jgi:hypothetical protein
MRFGFGFPAWPNQLSNHHHNRTGKRPPGRPGYLAFPGRTGEGNKSLFAYFFFRKRSFFLVLKEVIP